MTAQEIEKDIRVIKRTCRGQFLIPDKDREELVERWNQIKEAMNLQEGIAFKTALEFSLGKDIEECTTFEQVFRRVCLMIYSFTEDCGYDFNEIILSNPIDGKDHDYICPKCGQTGTYTAADYSGM